MHVPRNTATVLIATDDGRPLWPHCRVARTPGQRLRGLLGRPAPGAAEGLLLTRCRSVHSLLLRHPIDVLLLAGDGTVLRVVSPLAPWRASGHPRARAVLELAAGAAARAAVRPGMRLTAITHADGNPGGSRREKR